jgi:hypothetical protein
MGIEQALTKAYASADWRTVDINSLRAVAFSDHHRGTGDGADDFRRCEQAYCAALGWYAEQGFGLWLIGDVEELWENGPRGVMKRYGDVLALEDEFGDRLWRFYGNHDMEWRSKRRVNKFLGDRQVREALKVELVDGKTKLGTLFLVHGHQGTRDSGNALVVPIARLAVRVFWGTLQRHFGFASTSPATDTVLRARHDRAMAAWADGHPDRIVMVAGHTHHPVFPGVAPPDVRAVLAEREQAYADARDAGDGVPAARAARELARATALREETYEVPTLDRWSYFNTGCCSFGDGDVTGLEFADGKVRLVRWLDNEGHAEPHELTPARDLRDVFANVPGKAAPTVVPAGH